MVQYDERADLLADLDHLRLLLARRERIAELCRSISGSRDANEAIQVCACAMLAIFPELGRASVALVDDDGEHCHIHGLAGESTVVSVGTRFSLATTTVGQSIQRGAQILVYDTDAATFSPDIKALWSAGFRSIAITPFMVGERALGSLNAASADLATFDAEAQSMLWQIATIVASNLDRHRLLDALRASLADSQARELELQAVRGRQDEIIRVQKAHIEETAAPTIPISDRVIVIPMIGNLDDARARHFVELAVRGCHEHRAEVVLIDLTGLRRIDATAGHCFIAVTSTLRLLGARVVLTGMAPALAESLVGLGIDLSALKTSATLQSAVADALGRGAGRWPLYE